MCIVTDDGIFLKGAPAELVARLGARTKVGAARWSEPGIERECARIKGYRAEIGPQFAEFAAERLLENLEEEGWILIQR